MLLFPRAACKRDNRGSMVHDIATLHRRTEKRFVADVPRELCAGDTFEDFSTGGWAAENADLAAGTGKSDGESGTDAPGGPGDEDRLHLTPGRNPSQKSEQFLVEECGIFQIAHVRGTRYDVEL
jgi:hypothetical protein